MLQCVPEEIVQFDFSRTRVKMRNDVKGKIGVKTDFGILKCLSLCCFSVVKI